MWLFLTSLSFGISRSFCWGVLAALCVFVTCESAVEAQTCPSGQALVYQWTDNSGHTGTASAVCGAHDADDGSGREEYTPDSSTASTPSSSSDHGACDYKQCNDVTGSCQDFGSGPGYGIGLSPVLACAVTPCSMKQGKTVDTVVVDAGPQAPGTAVQGSDGCMYNITTGPTNVIGMCPGGMCAIQTAVGTGASVPSGATAPPVSPGDCFSSSDGSATCSQAAPQNGGSGQNCGTFNGDQVCVASIPPGTCVSYASGGVACVAASGASAVATPPAPNNGTGGQPATPSGQVSTTDATSGASTTANYYTSGVVHQSTTGVVGASGGQNVGNATGASGSTSQGASGGGSTPNAANGDCGASGVSCTGSVPASSWSGDCSDMDSCFQTFYTALGSAPLVQGAVSIETAWPVGSCDIGTVTLATFDNRPFDYGTTACQVWNDYIATPLSAILLACWAVVGIFIVMSA